MLNDIKYVETKITELDDRYTVRVLAESTEGWLYGESTQLIADHITERVLRDAGHNGQIKRKTRHVAYSYPLDAPDLESYFYNPVRWQINALVSYFLDANDGIFWSKIEQAY